MRSEPGSRAFVLHEAVTVVVLCVVAAVLAAASTRSRSLVSLGESMANLRKMHQATASFADDNDGRFATFSWRKGNCPSQYPDLVVASSDQQAAANQAVDIIRRRANLPNMPRISAWLPHVLYSHLVLADHLGAELPLRWMISPEDPKRLAFALDRAQWGANTETRRAFSGSYEPPTAFWTSPDSGGDAVVQAGNNYNLWSVPAGARFGDRRLDEVSHPAHKALYYDRHQRHFGPRQGYFMHEESRVPVATADGAVAVRRGEDANPGWNPHDPDGTDPLYVYYTPPIVGPFAWDPPALDPSGQDLVLGRYRWTRKALFGRDVDGPEVP